MSPFRTRCWRGLAVVALLASCGAGTVAPAEAPVVPAEAPPPAAELDVLVWLPPGADARAALPLVVVVHGLGDTPEHFLPLYGEMGLQARIVAPRAPLHWPTGSSWFSARSRDAVPAEMAAEMKQRADDLYGLLGRLTSEHRTVGKPVVSGFSQGGMVSFAMALVHPEAIAGAVPVAGWAPRALWPPSPSDALRTLPIRVLHGAVDPVIPVDSARALRDWLGGRHGGNIRLEVFEGVGHTINREMHTRIAAQIRSLLPDDRPAADLVPKPAGGAK